MAEQPKTHPVAVDIAHPEKLSRGLLLLKVFLGWLYVGIPHGIVLWLYSIGIAVVLFFAFWIILFTGKFPRGMFDFVAGYYRWSTRVSSYMSLMRDEYPPFSTRP